MKMLPSISSIILTALVFSGALQTATPGRAAEHPVSFSEEVLPILQRSCVACHKPGGEGYEASGLDLRSYESLMKGTKFGPIVIPGEPFVSNLMVLLEGRASPTIRMPFHGAPLRKCYIGLIRHWIDEGAAQN